MRILILHSRYASGSISGENRVVQDEARLLEDAGHDVCVWMPSTERLRGLSTLAAGAGTVWSSRAVRATRELQHTFQPDIVHCHNLFPLVSPGALRTASTSCPVVVTLHNYRLLCLPATFVRGGGRCEACLGRSPWRGVVHRCYRGSAAASAALATSLSVHRTISSFERVNLFLAVSTLVRDKHVVAGFPRERIRLKPNFVWPADRRQGAGGYFLYLGRLTHERGIRTLVEAWRDIPARLLLVGDGPERARLTSLPPNVELRDAVAPDEVPRLLAGARALLFPTLAYEGAPRAILESFAAGVPVIASRIGAVPELVEHDVSGLLLPSLDSCDIVAAAHRLLDDGEAERMGEGAWRAWRDRYSPELALANLEGAYETVLT